MAASMLTQRRHAPAFLKLKPIDDAARTGAYQLVFGAGQFAVARWIDDRWAFAGGSPLAFEPEGYRP